jgi:hypothetical protein
LAVENLIRRRHLKCSISGRRGGSQKPSRSESYDFIGSPGRTILRTVQHRKVRFQLFKMAPLAPNDDRSSAKSAKLRWALETEGLRPGET